MIPSLACICGGVGEVLIIGGIASGIAWLWRKLRRKPKVEEKCCDKHTGSHTHM